ncbi:hypothetical protein MFRU_013g00280 [Monilinia fructicola]|nr:hypothetical protein MFRU_013g00280 [Monilinia fructicola]
MHPPPTSSTDPPSSSPPRADSTKQPAPTDARSPSTQLTQPTHQQPAQPAPRIILSKAAQRHRPTATPLLPTVEPPLLSCSEIRIRAATRFQPGWPAQASLWPSPCVTTGISTTIRQSPVQVVPLI